MEDFLALMSKIKGMKFKSLKQTRQRKAQNDRIRSAAVKVKFYWITKSPKMEFSNFRTQVHLALVSLIWLFSDSTILASIS